MTKPPMQSQPNLFEWKREKQPDSPKTESMASSAPNIEASWLEILKDEFSKPYMVKLKKFLIEEKKKFVVYPKGKEIFNAFWLTPFNKVKVVILGQDPYHGRNQAHGLCFSVPNGTPPPPSLLNIFQELYCDLGVKIPSHGCLSFWAKQGVFLLNTVLTVRANLAHSHAGNGWEIFTDRVISCLSAKRKNLVFILWGRHAQNKTNLIDQRKHLILKAPHPSPFSADRGFLGCKHFSQVNAYLEVIGTQPIDWSLSKN